jgi:lipid II:glycine glycyltransferase (peptidoglycan interpeptide bridge formation enzyme)
MRFFLQKKISTETFSNLSYFVENHQYAHLFQHPSWTSVKKATLSLSYLYFWGEDENSGEIKMSALIRRHGLPGIRWAKYRIYRGPVCAEKQLMSEGILNLVALLKEKGAVSIQLNPFWPQPEAECIENSLSAMGFSPLPFDQGSHSSTLIIKLNQDDKTIFKGFRRFTQQRINKAHKSGLEVALAESENDIHNFFKLYNTLAVEKHMRQIAESFFINIWNVWIKNKKFGVFLITRYQGEIVSGLVVLKHNTRAVAHYSDSEFQKFPKLAKSQPTHWEAIRWAKKNQCTVYDLGGYVPHAPEESPFYGVNQFKRGFSKKQQDFVREHLYIAVPSRYWFLGQLAKLKRKLKTS